MPRTARTAPGDTVYHVLNRSVDRKTVFETEEDYALFEAIMEETLCLSPMRICAYTLMPNHWHFILWPENDGDLAAFMQRLTTTHAVRWRTHRHNVGNGHLYAGRYKSFPVGEEQYFYAVTRYVEQNALRAGIVRRAEHWRWGSLWRRVHGSTGEKAYLSAWPEEIPADWVDLVNAPLTDRELSTVPLHRSGIVVSQ